MIDLSLDDAILFYISEKNALANLELEDDGREQGQRNRFFLARNLAAWNIVCAYSHFCPLSLRDTGGLVKSTAEGGIQAFCFSQKQS